MIYFRDTEKKKLQDFIKSQSKKAMAIYGRRRVGKTELILDHISRNPSGQIVYFQCTSYDYHVCLSDFVGLLQNQFPNSSLLGSLRSFKDVFTYLCETGRKCDAIVIDEFPFLAKKGTDAATEFQWIIDHGLGGMKLILLGSQLSFMKHQIGDAQAPLYGRFDEILELQPFTFSEIHSLFPDLEDAIHVYAQTGGVAQYVMFFMEHETVLQGTEALFFNKNGRLFQEAGNMLMQELRDPTTYVSILRALAGNEKDSGQIAQKAGLDPRAVFPYLNKLIDLGILSTVENSLSKKKNEKRYKICDYLFRFHYTFMEPHISMITALGEKALPFILENNYREYLGFVYEEIIRNNCYQYAAEGRLPFMPLTIGKWWGNMMEDGSWHESEVDIIAYNQDSILIGECKYKNKKIGLKELEQLKRKAAYIPIGKRQTYFLLAGKNGFTSELEARDDVILITGA